MGWETRGKQRVYYRKRRIGDSVRSEYVGAGYSAELMAQLDAHERQQAEVCRRAFEEIQRREDAIDRQIDSIGEQLQQLVDATLLVSGYHQHRRQWRKQRG